MKTVILCGGMGTRLKEEAEIIPKPLVEIGGKPILWHIMNIYAHYGHRDFALTLGYKGDRIKEYFLNYYNLQSDLTVSLKTGEVVASKNCYRDWLVRMFDTGARTMTGGRLYRLRDKMDDRTFMLTYGDGLGNVDIGKLLNFHQSHGRIATVTAVRPAARFGGMTISEDGVVQDFKEKPQTGEGWVNGGFFVFQRDVFSYLQGDGDVLEGAPMERLAQDRQLMAYQHGGFWQCMDTARDRDVLEHFWASGDAPWKIWNER